MSVSKIGEDTLSYERFSAAIIEPFRFTDEERHETALRETDEVVALESHNGQLFSGLHLNRDFDGKPVVVRIGSMNSSSTTESQKYTAYQYAAAFPENPFVAIDLPSHGASDRHTAAQKLERMIKRSGSLIASAEAEAIANYAPDSQEFIIIGDSFGGQLVPDVATKLGSLGLTPLAIIGFDMSGVNTFSTTKTFLRLNKARRTGHSAYHAGEDNVRLDDEFERFCSELEAFSHNDREYNPFNVGKRDPLFTALTLLRPVTNSESGMLALERSLELNESMIAAMVSGGLSKICEWRKIEPRVKELMAKFGERFTWQVWPNDSHSMSIAPQQPRSAAYAKEIIDIHLNGRF